MKFCPNCGAKIDANSKFCTNCGTKIEENTVGTTQQVVSQPMPLSKNKVQTWIKNNKAIAIVAAVVVVLLVCFAAVKIHKNNNELFNVAVVKYEGTNGSGTAEVTEKSQMVMFKRILVAVGKKDGLDDKILNQLNSADSMEELGGNLEKIIEQAYGNEAKVKKLEKFGKDLQNFDNTDLKVTPNHDLKNGEKVTVSFSNPNFVKKLHDQYGIDADPKTFTVSGLN